jgi:exodeoxyribonuclease VII small subunit
VYCERKNKCKRGENVSTKKISFEEAFEQLEEIVENMEKGNMTLEDSLNNYQKGIELIKFCSKKIEDTERKITIITKNESGDIIESEFIK